MTDETTSQSQALASANREQRPATASTLPRVSVGLPVYNGEQYLEEAIKSLLAQTFTDFELVISDNASTDGTEEICRSYCGRDPRIRYFRNQENVGGSKNFARVFELSRASYFKWAAHDDLCAPTLLENCVAVLDANPAVVACYPGTCFIDMHGAAIENHDAGCNLRSARPSERVHQFLFSAETNCLPMYGLIRRDVLRKTSLVAPYVSSDQILLLQLALLGEFYEVPGQLFYFREHSARSIWNYTTFEGYLSWHVPGRKSRIQLPRWRLLFEFFLSVARSDIPWREARDCYISLLKWCYWHRWALERDLVMTVRQVATLVRGLPPVQDKKSVIVAQGAAGFEDGTAADLSVTQSASDGGKRVRD